MAKASTALHKVVEDDLRQKLASGLWKPGSMIPSENELASEYGISRMTARTAVTHLVGADLLYRIPGKGTFVAEPKTVARTPSYTCIREQLEAQGTRIETIVTKKEEQAASPEVADALSIRAGDPVYYIESIRNTDGSPLYLNRAYYPQSVCPNLFSTEIGQKKTCDVLKDNYGLVSHNVHETMMSAVATFSEAHDLGVMPGYPLLLLTDTYSNERGISYEFAKLVFRGDKIRLSFDFDTPRDTH